MTFIVVLIVKEVQVLVKTGRKYFQDCYNYIELIIIGFSWAAFSIYLYRMNQESHHLASFHLKETYRKYANSKFDRFRRFC